MRRLIALTATALVAPALALAASATAHAAPKPATTSPLDALRQQLAKRTTVRIDERTDLRLGRAALRYRETGVVRFGTSGPDASDTKVRVSNGKETQSGRLIAIGGKVYYKSSPFDEALPAGKTWVRTPGLPRNPLLLDVLQPQTLKALITHTKSRTPGGVVGGTRTTLLRGSITLGELAKAAPSGTIPVLLDDKEKDTALPWKLWVGGDQLPRRFASDLALGQKSSLAGLRVVVDARYTAWGGKVTIQAPPADQVIDMKDLNDDEDLPEARPDLITTITGRAARHG
ncbi:hypothetical protein Skr01_65430 [Sphaerisporangium krabiense]|uniref:Lipoprotein n=1 Tax=Sphaerisporangium krabiense TaxID=763782 RepID=A0A7W8YZU6_9ACTN|nr:hypothetical protein [Sphaerisporangium krabiense]MBB5624841.1 hypothetical protein [Sphaerisporangium krabiense]GII66458.1 hypothetical protein Skr01_65430 [Sphaerisporangium krabiense]